MIQKYPKKLSKVWIRADQNDFSKLPRVPLEIIRILETRFAYDNTPELDDYSRGKYLESKSTIYYREI